MIGAITKTTLSAAFGMMSSLNTSFTPSASDCSRPKGPLTLGPMRCCIRATTRRSNQIRNSVSSTRTTKITRVLTRTSQHGSWPKAEGSSTLLRTTERVHWVAPFTGTVLPGGREVGEHAATEGAGRQPDDASGRSAATAGSVTLPRSPVTVTSTSPISSAAGARDLLEVDVGQPRHGAPPGRAVVESPSCMEPRSTSCFQVASASRRPGRAGLRGLGRPRSGTARRRPTGPAPPSRGGPRRRAEAQRAASSSSAMPARTRRSGSDAGLARTVSKGAGVRPRSRRCRPCR